MSALIALFLESNKRSHFCGSTSTSTWRSQAHPPTLTVKQSQKPCTSMRTGVPQLERFEGNRKDVSVARDGPTAQDGTVCLFWTPRDTDSEM